MNTQKAQLISRVEKYENQTHEGFDLYSKKATVTTVIRQSYTRRLRFGYRVENRKDTLSAFSALICNVNAPHRGSSLSDRRIN